MPDHDVSPSPLLAVRGLAFSRDETPVFGPLDFSVDANEALLVQGFPRARYAGMPVHKTCSHK